MSRVGSRWQTLGVTSVDYEQVAATYHEGRSSLAQPEDWGRLIGANRAGRLRVLDVGAGTGIFTRAWPIWGATQVVGVDPSLAMVTEARRVGLPPQAQLVMGRAEHLPFVTGTFDAAWLSAVIHQVADTTACARELARVLTPGGRVYLRGFFAGSSRLGWLPYFPGSERAIARFPSIEEIAGVFRGAGFSVTRVDEIRTPARTVADARTWIAAMRHADTLLTTLTDVEIASGLAALGATESTQLDGSLHLVTLLAPG